MGKPCNKTKYTCGDAANFAECTAFEGTPNPQSELVGESCISIEDTTQDQFNQLESIWGEIDLSELGDKCLEYVETEEGKIVVKNVLLKFEEKICELQESIETLHNRKVCEYPITECLEDLGCLELPCNNSIITLGDWMVAVQNKICP